MVASTSKALDAFPSEDPSLVWFRVIAESVQDPLLLITRRGQIIAANRLASTYLGVDFGEPLSCNVADLCENAPTELDATFRLFERSSAEVPGRQIRLRRDGRVTPCATRGRRVDSFAASSSDASLLLRLLRDEGEVNRFKLLNEKIDRLTAEMNRRIDTEQKLQAHREHLVELVEERTRELRNAQAELVVQEKLAVLGELTAIVSHELRNPLGTIRAAAFAIEDSIRDLESPRLARSAQLVTTNVERCDRIISDLLDYSRSRVPNEAEIPLDAWLRELLAEFPWNGTECVERLESNRSISGDPEMLRRAVINVLTNARQAVEALAIEGGPRVTVTTSSDGSRVKIIVRDNGPGIPPGVRPKIFQPMFSTKSFGVGLGLPIVKSAMEAQGGGVEVEDDHPTGAKVTLWLPMGPEE